MAVRGKRLQTDVGVVRSYRLDVEEILARLQSDWSLLGELCDILAKEMPETLNHIRDAIERGNAEDIHRAVHYLKGSLGVFGRGPHTEVILRLEQAGCENHLRATGVVFLELEECMKDLLRAVEALKVKAHDRSHS